MKKLVSCACCAERLKVAITVPMLMPEPTRFHTNTLAKNANGHL